MGEAAPLEAPADALKIFISYSRADMAAADRMVADLERNGFSVTIDRRDLPYGEEWQTELAAFIAASDTVAWLVSPASVKSKWVNWELGEVGRLSKRLMPVKVSETDPATLPEALGRIHLLPAEGIYEPATHEAALVRALNTDRSWLKKATSLGADAREWISNDRDTARLLRGQALAEAEAWSMRTPRDVPAPASETLELILASRRGQDRRRRMTVAGSVAAALVAIGLAVAAFWQADIARAKTDEAEAAAVRALINERVSLSALSSVAMNTGRETDAVKLALAAWPRAGDTRPTPLLRTIQAMAEALPHMKERFRMDTGSAVSDVALSANRLLASADGSGSVRVWDIANRRQHLPTFGHDEKVNSVEFSADGSLIATASDDGTAKVWSASTGALLTTITGDGSAVGSASFAPDGSAIAVSDTGLIATVFRVETGTELARLEHSSFVTRILYSPDGRYLLALCGDRTAVLWDASTYGKIATLDDGWGYITSAVFMPDMSEIVTINDSGQMNFWGIDGKHIYGIDTGAAGDDIMLEVTAEGKLLTSANDGRVVFWDSVFSDASSSRTVARDHDHRMRAIAVSRDGLWLATGSGESTSIWELGKAVSSRSLRSASRFRLEDIRFSAGARLIVTASADGHARVWSLDSGTLLGEVMHGSGDVTAVALSPDGLRLMTAGTDGFVRLWDTRTFAKAIELEGKGIPIWSAALDATASRALAAMADGSVRVWNIESGGLLLETKASQAVALSAFFGGDGKTIVVATSDNGIRTYEVDGAQEVISATSPEPADRIQFSSDGKLMALIGEDSSVILQQADTQSSAGRATFTESDMSSLRFSPDNSRVVTVSGNKVVILRDVATGTVISTLDLPNVNLADFSPDGTMIVTASLDGTVHIIAATDFESGDAFQIACQRLGNNISLKDVEERYGLGELTPICDDNAPLPVNWSKLHQEAGG